MTNDPTFLKPARAFCGALLVLSTASGTDAASFDCAKASTLVETAICADADLSALDGTLATTYRQASRVPDTGDAIKTSQRDWLKQRNACQDAACLKRVYTQRITQLKGTGATPAPAATASGGCAEQGPVAAAFINAYKTYSDQPYSARKRLTPDLWVQKNKALSDDFKRAHKKLVGDAYKKGGEDGLGFDPIFDAQDYPEQGFKVIRCDAQTNYVTLKGIDPNIEPEPYEVAVKTVKTEQGWLVDGAGVVNIPEHKRAHRD